MLGQRRRLSETENEGDVMGKKLYWFVKWPWVSAVVVFLGLTQLPLGLWYVSAWFIIGAALLALIVVRAEKLRLGEAMALHARGRQPIQPASHQDATAHL